MPAVVLVNDSHDAGTPPRSCRYADVLMPILRRYDNEWGYSCRVVDLASYMAAKAARV